MSDNTNLPGDLAAELDMPGDLAAELAELDTTPTKQATTRRTKRRYAHELYPHAEGEVRPLAVEVPYLYAQMIGRNVSGTSWFDMQEGDAQRLTVARIMALIEARRTALLADALLQGMAGVGAWTWADKRASDESGEIAYERAVHYGVPVERIKPYPCGPEPDHHDHLGEPDARGWQVVTRIAGKESECPECTEDAPEQDPATPATA